MQKIQVQSLGRKDPLEKGMATQSSILAWRIPWTEEPCGLYSLWGHKESDTAEHAHTTVKSTTHGRNSNRKFPSVQPSHLQLSASSGNFISFSSSQICVSHPKKKVSTCNQSQMKIRQISWVTGWSFCLFWGILVPANQLAEKKVTVRHISESISGWRNVRNKESSLQY